MSLKHLLIQKSNFEPSEPNPEKFGQMHKEQAALIREMQDMYHRSHNEPIRNELNYSIWYYAVKDLEKKGILHADEGKMKYDRIRFKIKEFEDDPGRCDYTPTGFRNMMRMRKYIIYKYKKNFTN